MLLQVQKQHPQAFDRTIANLKYGSINVNVCNIIGYAVSRLTWGAFPGHTMQVRLELLFKVQTNASSQLRLQKIWFPLMPSQLLWYAFCL